jgi:hypothetical protein
MEARDAIQRIKRIVRANQLEPRALLLAYIDIVAERIVLEGGDEAAIKKAVRQSSAQFDRLLDEALLVRVSKAAPKADRIAEQARKHAASAAAS